MNSDEYYNSDEYNDFDNPKPKEVAIDYETVVDEIIDSRKGRYRWSMVDSEMRIWDAMVVGYKIIATTAELSEGGRQLVMPIKIKEDEDESTSGM